ncbi:MAG: hypothetical protein LUC26_07775, partial [Prevotella sp.]|nr:hypothetical protein [Prevotella sp.]
MSVGTSQADKATNSFDNTTYGASYYVTYTPDSNGTLYLSDSEILCYEDANSTEVTGTWESNGVNASAHTLTAGTTYYIVFSGGGVFGVSFYAWFEADESSDVEVSSSYGESLG